MNYDELLERRLETAVQGMSTLYSKRRPPIERERPWDVEDGAALAEVCLKAETLEPVAVKLGLSPDSTPDAVAWALVDVVAETERQAKELEIEVPPDFLEPLLPQARYTAELTRALNRLADMLGLVVKVMAFDAPSPEDVAARLADFLGAPQGTANDETPGEI